MTQLEGPENPDRIGALILFARRWSLEIIGLLLIGIAGMLFLELQPTIPRFWQVSFLAAVFASPIAYYTGSTVVRWLYDPKWLYLIDLSAAEEKGSLYRLPESQFRDLEVLDGQLDRLAPGLYVGKRVDLENNRVAGTWRGTLSDRDLLLSLRKVRECRGQLEEDARQGFILRSSAYTVVRRAVRDTTMQVVKTFERGSLPDSGEAMNNAIHSELEEFGITDNLEETIEDLAEEKLADSDLEADSDDSESFEFVENPEPSENGSEPTIKND
ncbi:ORF7 [Halorubrum pleomorphic virus 1]|uniref:Uncharacterized protein 7 n=1 Tax=Halorubrum pleomorphic virus 1 TaxID=634168 RepID=ORF7_HAPV1|nr:hypothetical protein HRPV-1_gp7 [Halorubrum pleomorphic virus 1]C1JJY6.1 RecName: Full=Uncharacterized protein 7 [Halorubrum pleomorphic virus 1]ACO54902.1 ORF7 [Halorubrum pleomorphic virus 1]